MRGRARKLCRLALGPILRLFKKRLLKTIYVLGPPLIRLDGFETSTNCIDGKTVLFFRVNELSNVVFSKFIAHNKMHKNVKDNIRKFVYPEKIFAI